MNILHVQQGTSAWHEARAKHFTASEAPAMLGLSKYTTRNDLLKQKATGFEKVVDAATQRRFDAGHAAEAAARALAENQLGESLFPVTGTLEVEGLPLLASFDGLTMDDSVGFENKLWNAEFAAYVRDNNDAPETHYPQLEQQLLISGANYVLFSVSDGTEENTVWLEYRSRPERRAQLIAGWKQFAKDLAEYKPEPAAAPVATAAPIENLPALCVSLVGAVQASNLPQWRDVVVARIQAINTDLQTDQDFADASAMVKFLGDAEKSLDLVKKQALSQTADIDELFRTIDSMQGEMKQKRLALDKRVTQRKDEIRDEILQEGRQALRDFITETVKQFGLMIEPIVTADFAGAMRQKKTVATLKDAVATELARAKAEVSSQAVAIDHNQRNYALLAAGHEFLFADIKQLLQQSPEAFSAMVENRITKHKLEVKEREEKEAQAKAAAEVVPTPAPTVTGVFAAADTHNVQPIAKQEDSGTRMKLGEISAALGFAVTSEFLAGIGYPVVSTDKNAKLYRACDFPAMCRAISAHVLAVAAAQQQKAA